MKPDELRALADEIERGDGTDLQRDVKFERALWGSQTQDRRNFTTNLQDAVEAVPEGWAYGVDYGRNRAKSEMASAVVMCDGKVLGCGSTNNNPAAALCAAILRAKTAEMEGD